MEKLLLIAIAPGVSLVIILYYLDKYDREPLGTMVKVFLFGCLSVIPTIAVGSFLSRVNIFTGIISLAFTAYIIAGFVEEYFKRAVVLRYVYNDKSFDERMDGIIYAATAALGFATIENIFYVFAFYDDINSVGVLRAIFAVPAHMLFGVTMGYYISLSKFEDNPIRAEAFMKKALWLPMILHGTYDMILFTENKYAYGVFIPFVLYLWYVNIKRFLDFYKNSRYIHTHPVEDGGIDIIDISEENDLIDWEEFRREADEEEDI